MYKSTHRAIARAIRTVGISSSMTEEQVLAMAVAMADVCEAHTPKSAAFDREVFVALATQRQMELSE